MNGVTRKDYVNRITVEQDRRLFEVQECRFFVQFLVQGRYIQQQQQSKKPQDYLSIATVTMYSLSQIVASSSCIYTFPELSYQFRGT
jgi:hypothetical protein